MDGRLTADAEPRASAPRTRRSRPSGRTSRSTRFEFGFGDKIAPRLGATFDVRGDGRVKAFASWGRYYDWTRYEIARGSFGGDLWHIYYRSLDTLDIGSLNLSNMPGQDLWGGPTGFRDLRATAINNTDPNIKPMFQDSFNGGLDFQLGGNTALGIHFVHNNLGRTIEDMGALVNGDSIYVIGNPGEGQNTITPASYPATENFATPKPKRQFDALELTLERRFSKNWFGSANYTWSRLYGNYSGTANSDEIQTPTTGITSKNAQQQEGTIARPGQQRAHRLGHRRAAVGFARQSGCPRPAGHRPAARREAVWRVPVRHRHADSAPSSTAAAARRSARRSSDRIRTRRSSTGAATWAARRS